MLSLNKSASSPPRKAMRCLSIVLVLVAAAAFTPKTTRGGLGLSTTTKPAALLSTATLQEEAVIVYPPDDKMPPKLTLALPIRETQTQTALLDAGDILASLARQPVPVRLTTDDDINTFEARAFAAADHGGVLTLLREGATNYIETWALTHHLDVVGDHSTGRKRASVVTAMERRVAAVSAKLSQGEQLTHGLDKAAEEWLDLVCVSKTSLELRAPFDELAKSYMYSGGDGCGTESGRMLISGPASLLYKVQQWMSRRGHLPLYIQQAAACFFAEHSLSQRQFVGMGQPILLGLDSDVRDALCEAKDQWAGVFAEGLATGFKGVLVVGMHGPDYRVWANKHSLPDAHVIDWSGLGADDFSERDGVVRSRAFQEIFDACRAHGVLGSGDEELLVGALHNLKRGVTDLIEALEISNVVPLGGGVFKVRGNPRACEKLKAWPADLPAAVALRNALAPLMRVDAFLEACKFVPVPEEEWGDVVDVDSFGKQGYVPGRFLNADKTARLTAQNDPDRGRVFCGHCNTEQDSKKDGQRTACGVCSRTTLLTILKEPSGKWA
uniref:Uncharacterized protein n=1 Tax=Pelagomonas calceolata TaxID=35677 RepID=A0A7S4E4A6_9STRA